MKRKMYLNTDMLLNIMKYMEIGETLNFSDADNADKEWYFLTRLDEKMHDTRRLYLVNMYGGGEAEVFEDSDSSDYESMVQKVYAYLHHQFFDNNGDDIEIEVDDEYVFNLTEYMKDVDDDDLVPWSIDEAINFSGSAGYGDHDDYWGKVNPVIIMLIWNGNFFKEIDRRKSKAVVMAEIGKLKEKIEELERKMKEEK